MFKRESRKTHVIQFPLVHFFLSLNTNHHYYYYYYCVWRNDVVVKDFAMDAHSSYMLMLNKPDSFIAVKEFLKYNA